MNLNLKGFLFVDKSYKTIYTTLQYSPCFALTRTIPFNTSIKIAIKFDFIVGEKPEFRKLISNLKRFKETDFETSKPIMLTFK